MIKYQVTYFFKGIIYTKILESSSLMVDFYSVFASYDDIDFDIYRDFYIISILFIEKTD